MNEWLLIFIWAAGGMHGSTTVTLERFATEAECQRIGALLKERADSWGPDVVTVLCGRVEPSP